MSMIESVALKISTTINLVFTVINLAVIVCIFGVGLFYADVNNWTHSPGGFFPFQFRGVSKMFTIYFLCKLCTIDKSFADGYT
jgi:amino acid transporter